MDFNLSAKEVSVRIARNERDRNRLEKDANKSKRVLDRIHNVLFDCPMPDSKEQAEQFLRGYEQIDSGSLSRHSRKMSRLTRRNTLICKLVALMVPISLSVAALGAAFVLNARHPWFFFWGLVIAIIGVMAALSRQVQRKITVSVTYVLSESVRSAVEVSKRKVVRRYRRECELLDKFGEEHNRYNGILCELAGIAESNIQLNEQLRALLAERIEMLE